MNELLKFYTKALLGLVSLATVWAFLPQDLMPLLAPYFGYNQWVQMVSSFLTSRFFIVVLLAAGEWIIRKWAWKVVHPELNFQGEWEGETTFTKVEMGSPVAPFSAKYKVRFEQDCLSFAIAPTKADAFVNWGSLAMNLVDKDTVRYAYWVNYSDPSRFPARATGYEEMRVIQRGWRGAPQELTGEFYHCTMGFQPVYSGNVTFKRKSKERPAPGLQRTETA